MRISDWSSDVCSSDLQRHAFMFTRGALKQLNTCFGNGTAVEETCQRFGRRQKTCALLGLLALLHFYQIGRASCRERVCQYVEISVVDGSLKTKNQLLIQHERHHTHAHENNR